jgi:FeS assembly protein IscX
MTDPLTWEDTYAIARALMVKHAGVDLQSVSLNDILAWTVSLPDFDDDLQCCNDAILMAIYRDWYEEANS